MKTAIVNLTSTNNNILDVSLQNQRNSTQNLSSTTQKGPDLSSTKQKGENLSSPQEIGTTNFTSNRSNKRRKKIYFNVLNSW